MFGDKGSETKWSRPHITDSSLRVRDWSGTNLIRPDTCTTEINSSGQLSLARQGLKCSSIFSITSSILIIYFPTMVCAGWFVSPAMFTAPLVPRNSIMLREKCTHSHMMEQDPQLIPASRYLSEIMSDLLRRCTFNMHQHME